MKTTQETYADIDDYMARHYSFAPSISRQKTVGNKSYYVRRYFKGGQDFEKTMERLAVKQSYMKDAG